MQNVKSILQFSEAIRETGLNPPDVILDDGKLHRFPSNGSPHDDAGWYVFYNDGIPAGSFGDWRTGVSKTWRSGTDRMLTDAEEAAYRAKIEAMRLARQEDEARRQADAAARAQEIWDTAQSASDEHPYLQRKSVRSHDLRVYRGDMVIGGMACDGCLLVPMTIGDVLHSLQLIAPSGDKRFLSSGRVKGCYFRIGSMQDLKQHAVVCIAEGYVTAASIHEATGYMVVAAFNAGNLEPVALTMARLREESPDVQLIVCADDDVSTPHNPGITKATAAAKGISGLLAVPNFGDHRPEGATDFNDLASSHGDDAIRRCIEAATLVPDPKPVKAELHPVDAWPTIAEEAMHGLAGDIVRLFEPHTEADPIALLVSFLAEFGTMLGRAPHLILDGAYHPLLFWPVLVGQSSKSRKGSAGNRTKMICQLADPAWTRGECRGTLSSGEGLAFAVRDAQYRDDPVKEHGRPNGEMVRICIDSGVEDKRLFLVQSEFGSVLKIMAREGNSLSGVLRDAWDGQDLAPMTKANRIKATAPHIGLACHVTRDELLRNLTDMDVSNGFGNRFCWFPVRRSKELPFSSSRVAMATESETTPHGTHEPCGCSVSPRQGIGRR